MSSFIAHLKLHAALGDDFAVFSSAASKLADILGFVESYQGDTENALLELISALQDQYRIISNNKDLFDELKIFDKSVDEVLGDLYKAELAIEQDMGE
ncbi:hypothetical protein [Acinetobacter phage HFM1]|nr:hypothetical protein [Acinetobacter phage HFM1]